MTAKNKNPVLTGLELARRLHDGECIECGEPFTEKNVHTELGWRETKISGMCEDCFDEVTGDPED